MNIISAKFIKGLIGEDEILENDIPQVVFIGRSNVGKSSLINSLTKQKGLAKTSTFPGRTQEINIFEVNVAGLGNLYLVDLPGYGFAKASKEAQASLQTLIYWYLFGSNYQQKEVIFIVDAVVGVTNTDFQMLNSLEKAQKNVIVVANKVDKLKASEYKRKLQTIKDAVGDYKVLPYSAEKKIGVDDLTKLIWAKK